MENIAKTDQSSFTRLISNFWGNPKLDQIKAITGNKSLSDFQIQKDLGRVIK